MSSDAEFKAPIAKRPLIILVGYRGTGKTTVANRLASRLGWSSIDADDEIERIAAKTIKQIFDTEGEQAFRDWESKVVAALCQRDRTVVALGGGAVLRPENRQEIQRGTVIWLTADSQTIAQRVAADPSTSDRRPNLTVAGGLSEIEQLLSKRDPLYRECADFAVDTRGKTPDRVVDEIVCLLNRP